MKRIETAVCKDDSIAVTFALPKEFAEILARNNFGNGVAHDLAAGSRSGSLATNGIEQFASRNRGRPTLHHH
jgi:hypothetical protein